MLRYGCVCADAVGASVGKCRMVTCVHTHVEFPPRFRMHRAATGNFQHIALAMVALEETKKGLSIWGSALCGFGLWGLE